MQNSISCFGLSAISALCLSACASNPATDARAAPVDPSGYADATWDRARSEVVARLNEPVRPQNARNVILFIADGMSISTITAARIYDGQSRGDSGVENLLSFEQFPNSALIRTYDATQQVPDSASTATAMVTGIKTRAGAISLGRDQYLDACAVDAALPATMMELAETRGLATGVVSSARITHATPATLYAHSISRSWENDGEIPDYAVNAGCIDIASQLIAFNHGDGPEVALGGGRGSFLPADAGGVREDGRDLTAEWQSSGRAYVSDAAGLRALDPLSGPPVLGLFTNSHLSYAADRDDAVEPSLAELTGFAIDRLSGDEDGFFLMVEAGRVDHAHHGTNAYRALTDMQAFDAAIRAALARVDLDETLILVTADHGHTFEIAGYPMRGNPILGLARSADPAEPGADAFILQDQNGLPYTTLGYLNGPNVRRTGGEALTEAAVLDPDYRQEAAVQMWSETHSGTDVALFANGPRAYYFDGSLEQNTIFHLIVEAYGWGVGTAED